MCLTGCSKPANPCAGDGGTAKDGTVAACDKKVKGTPAAISPTANSIICKSGVLVVQNNNSGPDKSCTDAHERSHIQDWKGRYGDDLCSGVPDGSLPLGGDGYDDFIQQSECKAYKVGKACREQLLKTAADADKAAIQSAIDRDNAQIASRHCT
jgi:hypothetical protein